MDAETAAEQAKIDAMSADELRAEIGRLREALIRAEWQIAELEERADVDSMLDVLNRRGFERELGRALAFVKRYDTPAALMFLDLDGFKMVNDQHGHAAGDALLKEVAGNLVRHLRASDVVGRLGGDEFGAILWNAQPPQALAKARSIELTVEKVALPYNGAMLGCGASAGVVALDPALTPVQMIGAADRAMYARKRERRG